VILDTNALSAVAEGEPAAVAQFARARKIALPVIVLGEYRFGIAQSRKRIEYELWLSETLTGYVILNVDDETSVRYAEIRLELKQAGTPIPANDAWIAALAREHTLPVLSRDNHFDFVEGITRLPW
jgi:tRNA(fMet)-specific endonuclease VapC